MNCEKAACSWETEFCVLATKPDGLPILLPLPLAAACLKGLDVKGRCCTRAKPEKPNAGQIPDTLYYQGMFECFKALAYKFKMPLAIRVLNVKKRKQVPAHQSFSWKSPSWPHGGTVAPQPHHNHPWGPFEPPFTKRCIDMSNFIWSHLRGGAQTEPWNHTHVACQN